MSFWETIKYRKPIIIYVICSSIVFILCTITLTILDLQYENEIIELWEAKQKGIIPANLIVLIPITYLYILGYLVVKYKEFKNHVKSYQSFKDYSLEFQEKVLTNIYCRNCSTHSNMSFKEEKMIDGMRWIFVSCPKCDAINKKRLS